MFTFKKPKNELEQLLRQITSPNTASPQQSKQPQRQPPDGAFTRCPGCGGTILTEDLEENLKVCLNCGYHFPLAARQRLERICDSSTFVEFDANLQSVNPLEFPDYNKKLVKARQQSGEKEAVITGVGEIEGYRCAVFAMDGSFMRGSMGCVVGEKIVRLFEYAEENRLAVIGFTASGGARMQEGILSLMQMAKTSGAVKRHSDAGLLYVTVLTDPTSGGVTASFAMEGDILLGEPGARICFAGPRVIEQTIRQTLPQGFQKSEFLLEKGFLDDIVPRTKQKPYLAKLLSLHQVPFHQGGPKMVREEEPEKKEEEK